MPDEINLPTADEVRKLPRWAVVAFAERCARRIEPLLAADYPDAPREQVPSLEIAIGLAESCAGGIAALGPYRAAIGDGAQRQPTP